jgi:predicted KAP-like P-loop ATPase
MNPRSFLSKALICFTAGGLVGSYLPRTDVSQQLSRFLHQLLFLYPAWFHLPLIAFLFALLFSPFARLLNRCYQNWRSGNPPFTIIEAAAFFMSGAVVASLLNGSMLFRLRDYPQDIQLAILVWGGAAISFFLSSAVWAYMSPQLAEEIPASDPLVDSPIGKDSDDTLGRVAFVDALYQELKSFPYQDSFVFGLNGEWGVGKTSILNLLRNRLRADKGTLLVEFNPWYFPSPEVVLRRFYESISIAINEQFFFPDMKHALQNYSKLLAPILKPLGIELWTKIANPEDTKRLIESYILQTGRKIVLIIDDLDRASSAELLVVLQIVRLSASFRNTLFVLAYDDEQLNEQLKHAKISRDFLGKIVQRPVRVPSINRAAIDQFLVFSGASHRCQLDVLFDKLEVEKRRRDQFDKQIIESYWSDVRPFFKTLRDAKRFMNLLVASFPAVKNEVHLMDFFLLEVIELFAPAVHRDIWRNRYYYVPPTEITDLLASPLGYSPSDAKAREANNRKIREHIESLLKGIDNSEVVLGILKKLFPYQLAEAFATSRTHYSNDSLAAARALKRITNSDSFDKYFMLSVPEGTIPDAVVESAIKSWNNNGSTKKIILESIESFRTEGKLTEFLVKLVIFRDSLEDQALEPLLGALAQLMSTPLDNQADIDQAFRLALFLLNDRIADSKKQPALETLLRELKPIDIAVKIANALAESSVGTILGLQKNVDLQEIRQLIVLRFREEYVEPKIDIFETDRRPTYVLYQLGTYNAETAKMVNEYTLRTCSGNPHHIGELLLSFVVRFPTEEPSLQFNQLKTVFDVQLLAELARRVGDRAWSNDEEKRAVEIFLEAADKSLDSPV